jgi:hypothetical protein
MCSALASASSIYNNCAIVALAFAKELAYACYCFCARAIAVAQKRSRKSKRTNDNLLLLRFLVLKYFSFVGPLPSSAPLFASGYS